MVNELTSIKTEFHDLSRYKNILKSLVINNLVGKYKNSMLGCIWHIAIPLVMIVVYYIVFTEIREHPMDQYWVFLASGIFPFNFMMLNLLGGSSCIVNSSSMIKKMYFPRELIVLSQVISTLIVTLAGYVVIISIIFISGYPLDIICVLIAFAIIIMSSIFVLGYVLLLSSVVVYVRDIQYALNSISIVFYFITPIYFMASEVEGALKAVIWANPFTYFLEVIHKLIYYGDYPTYSEISMCVLITTISIVVGSLVFRKLKRGFVERL